MHAENIKETNFRWIAFVLISGLIFSLSYVLRSDISGLWSRTENLALLKADWPYKPRFIIAWAAYHLVPIEILNSVGFRTLVALISWVAALFMLPYFIERLKIPEQNKKFAGVAFLLIMLAHYCLPNIAAPYYIYDLPAIPFYLVVFILLTSDRTRHVYLGVGLLFLFYLNRESISVAIFHSVAWRIARNIQVRKSLREDRMALLAILIAFVGTLLIRQFLLGALDGNSTRILLSTLYEDGHLRLLANISRVWNEWGSRQQFIAIGFGLILYAPFLLKKQNIETRFVFISSIFPLMPALILGNFTELRIYNEFIPITSCILASFLSTSAWNSERV
jgi:hypothetical protein